MDAENAFTAAEIAEQLASEVDFEKSILEMTNRLLSV
jgi:hypothetical protein